MKIKPEKRREVSHSQLAGSGDPTRTQRHRHAFRCLPPLPMLFRQKEKKLPWSHLEGYSLNFAKGLAAMGTPPFLLSPFAVFCEELSVRVQTHSSQAPDTRHHASVSAS